MTYTVGFMSKKHECPEHDLFDCYDCIQTYGFYVENYQENEACENHEDKPRFEFSTPTESCKKCGSIDKRFIFHVHILNAIVACKLLLYMNFNFIYSEFKCIGAIATSLCKTCDTNDLCSECAKNCHKGHEIIPMKNTGENCSCIHDNPFISFFTSMLNPDELSKEGKQSQFKDNSTKDVRINISEDEK